jgi:heat induced stress protein YflT
MTDVATPPPASRVQRTIYATKDYRQAERAVDWLSDQGFAVADVSIVGSGLRYVERVGGRLTTARAALSGARQGAWIGLFIGLLFTLFFNLSTGGFFGVLLYTVVTGALFWALWMGLFHYLQRGRRDFSSTAQTVADSYEVRVDERTAHRAADLLGQMPPATA